MAAITICSDFGASKNKVWHCFHCLLSCIGEGNGNPLQYSYLENLRDRGAWWAAVYGVAQSRTRLKQLSSSSMYGCESWTIKKAEGWRIDVFELWCWRTLESPLDCKDIQPVHPKGNQFWLFIGRSDAEAETAILWPPDVKSQFTGKNPDAGKDWGQEEKGWQRMRWLDGIMPGSGELSGMA